MRLFGVDISIPTSKTTTTTTTTLRAGPDAADHGKALILCTNPITTSSSSSSGKRKMSSERSIVPWTTSSSSAPTSALTISSEENSNANLGKKARKAKPSGDKVDKAKSNGPPLSTLLKFKVMSKLGIKDLQNCNPKMIFQKFVFESDIKKDQARLLIPAKQLIGNKEENFLNEAELVKLNKVGEISVKVMYYKHINDGDGDGDREVLKDKDLKLSRWPKAPGSEDAKKRSVSYALRTRWNEVVKDIDLKFGDSIQVWAFRYPDHPDHPNVVDDKLALVLVKLGNPRNFEGNITGDSN